MQPEMSNVESIGSPFGRAQHSHEFCCNDAFAKRK